MSLDQGISQVDRIADRLAAGVINKQLMPAYKSSLDDIRGKLARLYEKHSVNGELSLADVSRYNRLYNLEKDIAKTMSQLRSKQVRVMSKLIKEVYQETYYRSAFTLEKVVQANLAFGMLPVKQVEASILNPLDRIGWPDRTLEAARIATRQIRETVTRGIIEGKDYGSLARDIKERIDISAGRAQRIAQTEAHRAREEGKLAMLEDATRKGIDLDKTWSAALDERTRQTHGSMDGQSVAVFDEEGNPGKFRSPAGGEAEYPGGFGIPEEDINCRCSVKGVINGYSPEVRRAREEGIIPYTNYRDYAKAKGWPSYYSGPEPGKKMVQGAAE